MSRRCHRLCCSGPRLNRSVSGRPSRRIVAAGDTEIRSQGFPVTSWRSLCRPPGGRSLATSRGLRCWLGGRRRVVGRGGTERFGERVPRVGRGVVGHGVLLSEVGEQGVPAAPGSGSRWLVVGQSHVTPAEYTSQAPAGESGGKCAPRPPPATAGLAGSSGSCCRYRRPQRAAGRGSQGCDGSGRPGTRRGSIPRSRRPGRSLRHPPVHRC